MKDGHTAAFTSLLKCFFNSLILLAVGALFLGLSFGISWKSGAFILGAILAISFILYYSSLKLGEVSEVVPYIRASEALLVFTFTALTVGKAAQVYPIAGIELVFVLIISTLFLKEKFTLHKLLAVISVFLGVWLVSG